MAKFNIEDNFFIIDSNNLEDVQTKLYGYCILESSNKDIEKLDDKLNLSTLGTYVYLYVDKNKITITQDFYGSYGIYLFQDKDYFALSNSFIYLVDYIKTKHKISFNKDYANYLLITDLCSEIYADTMVNEIKMLDRNAVIEIDKISKEIKINHIDYDENIVEIGSNEFFDIIDNWYYRWINIIKSVKFKTNNISTDLSGGIDSRLVLSLFLASEIDLNTISINSFTDDLYCHSEDFEIASKIANDYRFNLNNNLNIEKSSFSLEDILNISFYTKLCFHKEMWFQKAKNNETIYKFSGFGGELIRDFWKFETVSDFIQEKQKRTYIYPKEVRADIINSIEKVINKSLLAIEKKLNFREFDVSDLLLNLYRETRCRNHFGKASVEYFAFNIINLAPLLDPELNKLKLNSDQCKDRKSLLTIIFNRFAPDLLNYKFEGKRFISKDTIEFARKINNIKPLNKNNNFTKKEYKIVKSIDLYPYQKQKNINVIKQNELSPDKFLINLFHSDEFKYLFTVYYNQSILDTIDLDIKKRKFYPLRHAYAIIGITKIISDVLISEKVDKFTSVFDEINNFTNNGERIYDFCKCYSSLNEQIKTKNEQIKTLDEQIKTKDEQIKTKNEYMKTLDKHIKNRDSLIRQQNDAIQNLNTQNNIQDQVIKQLQNSWSYRIGRAITCPLSMPLDFYRFIRDYNLINKSGLFDSEYYLANNEDVKKAKADPLKHYLKFGWKEGRNPSAEFDGNEYLNKRPDLQAASLCPLVHYIKFGK